MKRIALITALIGLGTQFSVAYVLEGQFWNVSAISIVMNLNATEYRLTNPHPFPLEDGSRSYQQVYYHVAPDWNQYLLRFQIYPAQGHNATGGAFGNGVNNLYFATTAFGSKLDGDTLALTDYFYDNNNHMVEADTAYNATIRWNSYRGPLWFRSTDIRRVMLHETGHIIGLDHPDLAGQQVNSIMNSVISNTDDLTNDDVTGAKSLYGARAPAPPPLPYNPNGVEED
jgi:Matrixin